MKLTTGIQMDKMENDVNHPQFWEDIYLEDDAGWDLGGVTPVFESIANNIKPGNVCILGCGRGYDAVMFSQKGFDVTAVDFTPSAIKALTKLAEEKKVNVTAIQSDIFTLIPEFEDAFDYIIEQTCFCAIDPILRQEYERLVKNLLKPGGRLVGLWFPLDKPIDDGGPPWGTTVDEVKSIFKNGWTIKQEEFPDLSIESRKGREKMIIFRKV